MQNNLDHVESTEGTSNSTVKKPGTLLLTVAVSFIVPIVLIILIVKLTDLTSPVSGNKTNLTPDAIAERIAPIAKLAIAEASQDTDGPVQAKTGEEVYNATCAACHSSGVADAPKFGDSGDWAPYIETGYEAMFKVALEGKGAMPARGGNTNLSDLEVERAMVYMANSAGASFDEPTDDAGAADDSAASEDTADQSDDSASSTESSDDSASADAPAGIDLAAGEKLYKTSCFACHAAGVAGAPKFGDKDAWAPYVETGMEAMLEVAIKGKGLMPPRGGSTASDDELHAAIQYMINALD